MFASRMKHLESSGIRKMFEMAAKMKNPVDLSLGQADFDVPDAVKKVAVEAIQKGAYHYLAKGYDIDYLRLLIRNAAEVVELKNQVQSLTGYGDIKGRSAPMNKVFNMIEKISGTDVTVLLTGESGTGKELVALELHKNSPRAAEALVTVNSAAIPDNLIESELFGHERGAFTGATQSRSGKFENARGGTLFLDEIGDMPLDTQAKILRVLEEKKISGWVVTKRSMSTYGSSVPPTVIFLKWLGRRSSGKISFIDSRC